MALKMRYSPEMEVLSAKIKSNPWGRKRVAKINEEVTTKSKTPPLNHFARFGDRLGTYLG